VPKQAEGERSASIVHASVPPRTRRALLASLLAVPFVIAACGGTGEPQGDLQADNPPEINVEGLPPALAENVERANVILDGGEDTLAETLEGLEGHPVVVNQWASWCPPCEREFPLFAQAAATFAEEVGFLGIDAQDSRDAAADFLAENPVPYPHVFDPNTSQAASLGIGRSWPSTAFLDERGEVAEVFQGEYVSQEQLDDQIRRALLDDGG
jgi:cytochrome c biogenesis protein CcmG, thiol:disulfide interchange protein DsbE